MLVAVALLAACGGNASADKPGADVTTASVASGAMDVPAMLDGLTSRGYKCLHEDAHGQTIYSYGTDSQAVAGDASAFRVMHKDGVGPWTAVAQDGELWVRAPEPGDTSAEWYGDVLHAAKTDPAAVLAIPAKPSSCLPTGMTVHDAHRSEDGYPIMFKAALGDGTAGQGWLYHGGEDALIVELSNGEKIRVSINTPLHGGIWGLIYPADLPETAESSIDDVVPRVQNLTARFLP